MLNTCELIYFVLIVLWGRLIPDTGSEILLCVLWSTPCVVCISETLLMASLGYLIYFCLCDSAMTPSVLTQLFCLLWLLWEETKTPFFLEHFYCTPTWVYKNESGIRFKHQQCLHELTYTVCTSLLRYTVNTKSIVFLIPSTGPTWEWQRAGQ